MLLKQLEVTAVHAEEAAQNSDPPQRGHGARLGRAASKNTSTMSSYRVTQS